MSDKVRVFYFDVDSGTTTDYRDAIRAALDDEGLRVSLRQGERLVCVVKDGMDVVAIPTSRIVEREWPR